MTKARATCPPKGEEKKKRGGREKTWTGRELLALHISEKEGRKGGGGRERRPGGWFLGGGGGFVGGGKKNPPWSAGSFPWLLILKKGKKGKKKKEKKGTK